MSDHEIGGIISSSKDRYGKSHFNSIRNKYIKIEYLKEKADWNLETILRDSEIKNFIPKTIKINKSNEHIKYEQDSIPFQSVISEWSFNQVGTVALNILNFQRILKKHRLSLEDLHPWNFIFEKSGPKLVDIFAILRPGDDFHWGVGVNNKWGAINQFWEFYINSLIVKIFYPKPLNNVFINYSTISSKMIIKNINFIIKFGLKYINLYFLKSLITKKIKLPHIFDYKLLTYFINQAESFIYKITSYAFKKNFTITKYQLNFKFKDFILQTKKIDQVIIAGDNHLVINELLDNLGGINLLTDNWDTLEKYYYLFERKHTFAFFDFLNPTPSSGINNTQFLSAFDRFKSDNNLFIINLDYLFIHRKMTLSEIHKTMLNLSRNNVYVIFFSFNETLRYVGGKEYIIQFMHSLNYIDLLLNPNIMTFEKRINEN